MRAVLIASLTAATALYLSACTTTPEDQSAAKAEERKPAPTPVESKPIARVDVPSKPGAPGSPLKDPSSILSKRSIYFDYDKFEVRDEFKPLVEAHAKYLRDNRGAKILIQGNADERGSREYNLGLGQRRSDNVKKMLTLLGVTEAQIESVSLGEEKPACADHNEQCWAKNRRGDILYSGEY